MEFLLRFFFKSLSCPEKNLRIDNIFPFQLCFFLNGNHNSHYLITCFLSMISFIGRMQLYNFIGDQDLFNKISIREGIKEII